MKVEWYQGHGLVRPLALWREGERLLVVRWKPLAIRRNHDNREYREFMVELEEGSVYRVSLHPDGETIIMAMPKGGGSASPSSLLSQ